MTQKNILDVAHITAAEVKNAQAWFDNKAAEMTKLRVTPARLLKEAGTNLTHNIIPGRMYCFMYDPKNKETLPYYDTFPLVIPFGRDKSSFIGLNFHYLNYKDRMFVFRELLKISGNTALTDTTKIKYTWEIAMRASTNKFAKVCVKRYLYSHVGSPFMAVQPNDYHTILMLPVQRFVGATNSRVWSQVR